MRQIENCVVIFGGYFERFHKYDWCGHVLSCNYSVLAKKVLRNRTVCWASGVQRSCGIEVGRKTRISVFVRGRNGG